MSAEEVNEMDVRMSTFNDVDLFPFASGEPKVFTWGIELIYKKNVGGK